MCFVPKKWLFNLHEVFFKLFVECAVFDMFTNNPSYKSARMCWYIPCVGQRDLCSQPWFISQVPVALVAPHVLALNGALGKQTVVSLSDLPTSRCVVGVFQLCLCILITTSDSAMSADNYIILGVGVFWACLTAAVGAVAVSAHPSNRHLHHQPMRKIAYRMYNKQSKAHMVKYTSEELWFLFAFYELFVVFQVLKEAKALVWVFMVQNLPQVAFFVYLMYSVSFSLNLHEWRVQSALWSSRDEHRQSKFLPKMHIFKCGPQMFKSIWKNSL